ncbi:MAG: SCO family protein [Akkermansiaceae bacterium]
MSKTKTLIIFYTGVAAVCVGILCVVYLYILPKIRMQSAESESFMNVGQQVEQQWFPIGKDLVAQNQGGETVRLSDLRGKVWVVAEFFAVCPHCMARNGAELTGIYNEFKDHPDFHMVCISVDPEADNVERLKEYGEVLNADVSDWWFLNAGEEKATHEYLENTLKFFGIRERTDPEDIEANGRFQHDMGLLLVDRDFNVVGKWPLSDARSEEGRKLNPTLYEDLKKEMFDRIATELAKDSE